MHNRCPPCPDCAKSVFLLQLGPIFHVADHVARKDVSCMTCSHSEDDCILVCTEHVCGGLDDLGTNAVKPDFTSSPKRTTNFRLRFVWHYDKNGQERPMQTMIASETSGCIGINLQANVQSGIKKTNADNPEPTGLAEPCKIHIGIPGKWSSPEE